MSGSRFLVILKQARRALLKNLDSAIGGNAPNVSDHDAPDQMTRHRVLLRTNVVAIDQERHALEASRFFSDALRACFRMTRARGLVTPGEPI